MWLWGEGRGEGAKAVGVPSPVEVTLKAKPMAEEGGRHWPLPTYLMHTLTSLAAREEPAGPAMSSAVAGPPLDPSVPLVPVAEVISCGDEPPEIIERNVVATRHDSRAGCHSTPVTIFLFPCHRASYAVFPKKH